MKQQATQEAGACLDISTASKHIVKSMSQPTYQCIEGTVMDFTVDDSLYAKFQTWKLKCENIMEAELAIFMKIQYSS